VTAPPQKAPFVAQLRSRPGAVRLGGPDEPVLYVRVTAPEQWETLLFEVAPSVTVLDVKRAALAALLAEGTADDFVCKLNGFEMLDETLPVAEAGVRDGSTILLTYRRRRPVR
jgi:hypothetical protein